MGDRVTVGSVRFDTVSLDEAVECILDAAKKRTAYPVVTPNAIILRHALHDKTFLPYLQNASLVLPDGVGIRIFTSLPARWRLPLV